MYNEAHEDLQPCGKTTVNIPDGPVTPEVRERIAKHADATHPKPKGRIKGLKIPPSSDQYGRD